MMAYAVLFSLALTTAGAGNVVIWKPANISSPQFESHAAFDPRTGDLYFVRSSPSFEGWRIFTSHCARQGWTAPQSAEFAGDGVEADPYFVDGGKALYFISTRSTDGIKRKDLDIWRVERTSTGAWGTPRRLPEPVNSTAQEWFPRPAPDGWLYFGSARPGGLGKTDIWRAKQSQAGKWLVENAGPTINTAGDEYEPLPSPDGETLIVEADNALYTSKHTKEGWSQRVALGPEVNVNGSEIGALFSPSGHSLLFARDTKTPDSGEFFVWHLQGQENWPPVCGQR
jgi:WD40-like Beta Propeller Repeat